MTREDAINTLKSLKEYYNDEDEDHNYIGFDKLDNMAIDTAIKALEQQTILDKVREEIEQLPTTKCTETHRIYIDGDDFKKNVLVILNKYKAESEE